VAGPAGAAGGGADGAAGGVPGAGFGAAGAASDGLHRIITSESKVDPRRTVRLWHPEGLRDRGLRIAKASGLSTPIRNLKS